MKVISYANSLHDLATTKEAGVSEVILGHRDLNRTAPQSSVECNQLMAEAKRLDLKVILEWDVLYTENQFSLAIEAFNTLDIDLIDSIRVQDIGVLEFVLCETTKPIQFIAETGNHNLAGLRKWESYIGARLERMIVSIELSKVTLAEYIKELSAPIEYLGLGRILLFYSPRKLLSPIVSGENEAVNYESTRLEALGESEESPHKGFPLLENKHGTFMYHIKDLFLLDKLTELKDMDLPYIRIDLRFEDDLSLLTPINRLVLGDHADSSLIKEQYSSDVIRGYFQINKSDVIFKKLKNYRILRKDSNYVGEVIEILKGEYLAINLKGNNQLKVDDQVSFITPEGKELLCKVHFLKDTSQSAIDTSSGNNLVIMNYMSGVWPKSQLYLK